jgi:hypothetical protein
MSFSAMYHSAPATDVVLRDLGNGISCQFLQKKQILIFILKSSTHAAAETLNKTLCTYIEAWPQTRPLKVLYDYSDRQATITSAMREQMEATSYLIRQKKLRASSAIVVPKTYVSQMLQLYYLSHTALHHEIQVFFTHGDGLAWLEQAKVSANPQAL